MSTAFSFTLWALIASLPGPWPPCDWRVRFCSEEKSPRMLSHESPVA